MPKPEDKPSPVAPKSDNTISGTSEPAYTGFYNADKASNKKGIETDADDLEAFALKYVEDSPKEVSAQAKVLPKTGDVETSSPWLAGLALSILGFFGLTAQRKKSNN